jgi:hypothetical protein
MAIGIEIPLAHSAEFCALSCAAPHPLAQEWQSKGPACALCMKKA